MFVHTYVCMHACMHTQRKSSPTVHLKLVGILSGWDFVRWGFVRWDFVRWDFVLHSLRDVCGRDRVLRETGGGGGGGERAD